MPKLNASQIKAACSAVPAWRLARGALRRDFTFADFAAAMRFVNAVARAAEKADHHPDIDIRWNKVRLTWITHSAGGLTANDFALAQIVDRLTRPPARARRAGKGLRK